MARFTRGRHRSIRDMRNKWDKNDWDGALDPDEVPTAIATINKSFPRMFSRREFSPLRKGREEELYGDVDVISLLEMSTNAPKNRPRLVAPRR